LTQQRQIRHAGIRRHVYIYPYLHLDHSDPSNETNTCYSSSLCAVYATVAIGATFCFHSCSIVKHTHTSLDAWNPCVYLHVVFDILA
jgi:hypothetical protein